MSPGKRRNAIHAWVLYLCIAGYMLTVSNHGDVWAPFGRPRTQIPVFKVACEWKRISAANCPTDQLINAILVYMDTQNEWKSTGWVHSKGHLFWDPYQGRKGSEACVYVCVFLSIRTLLDACKWVVLFESSWASHLRPMGVCQCDRILSFVLCDTEVCLCVSLFQLLQRRCSGDDGRKPAGTIAKRIQWLLWKSNVPVHARTGQ